MINNVTLTGRLTKDVDSKTTQSGTTVASFTLAVDRRFKKDGQPDADFIRCIAFGKQGDALAQYNHKGSLIGLVGHIQTGSYENQQGQRVYTTDVIVDQWTFLESKNESQGSQGNWQPHYQNQATQNTYGNSKPKDEIDLPDDSLPF